MSYPYLIAAALQEELHEFIALTGQKTRSTGLQDGLEEVLVNSGNKRAKVALYTPNKMGMPYNAAKLMEVVEACNPKYIFFIGTCAGLDSQPIGSVLVPQRAFSYESGKVDKGRFRSDYQSYDFSQKLRTQAEAYYNMNKSDLHYTVASDEDICSGAAVINDEAKAMEIKDNGARKLTGLDMEAFSIACLNQIRKPDNEFLVIKGISDLAFNKEQSENAHGKDLAKKNSAGFAMGLLHFLIEKGASNPVEAEPLSIESSGIGNKDYYYNVRVLLRVTNNCPHPIAVRSHSFTFNSGIKLDPLAANTPHVKPLFSRRRRLLGYNYEAIIVLNPNSQVECWLPIDPSQKENIHDLIKEKAIGHWALSWFELGGECRKKDLIVPI